MSKFENLTARADSLLTATDIDAAERTYASVTEMRVSLAPVWAALTMASAENVKRSLSDIGAMFNEPKPTVDRYVRLGLVLLALDKVSDKQTDEITSLVGAATADRGRISTDGIKAVANECTSATDAIARLREAAEAAKVEKAEKDAEKAAEKAAEAEAEKAAEAEATDAEVIAGFAGIVSALTLRLVTMGPDETDALAALVDSLAASVAARVSELDALVSVA